MKSMGINMVALIFVGKTEFYEDYTHINEQQYQALMK